MGTMRSTVRELFNVQRSVQTTYTARTHCTRKLHAPKSNPQTYHATSETERLSTSSHPVASPLPGETQSAEATRLQVRNMFTKIHLREEDRAVVPAIARRSDGKVLVVIRVRGCQMRVAFGELQRERLAVDVIHHASSVLLEDESLIYQLVIAG